jgi:hypothetical protein
MVFGVDAFYIREGGRIQPDMGESVDFTRSPHVWPGPTSSELASWAIRHIKNRTDPNLWFEISFDDPESEHESTQ